MPQGKAWDQDQILETLRPFFQLGCSVTKACDLAEIESTTVLKWLQKSPELSARVKAWQNYVSGAARQVAANKIVKEKDFDAAKWWLERRDKEDFLPGIGVAHSGAVDLRVFEKKASELTDAELMEALAQKKLEERYENLRLAEADDEFKALLLERAKRDIVFYVNQFCWTYDPRPGADPNHCPFLTFDFQDEYLQNLESSYRGYEDLRTEKSRDMGATWLNLAWLHHHWRFDDSFKALIGSEKEDKADNFQEDSLFGKLDYLSRRMVPWALPAGFMIEKHRSFLKLINPVNNNSILGDSANPNFSRQGRYSAILLDEFAFWQYADSVWTATADAAPFRSVISTPKGKNNKFADLKFLAPIKNVRLHWTQHPLKTQEWYENEKKRRTPREIAQELDIDYEASGSERVFMLRQNKTLRQHVVVKPFEIPKNWRAFRAGLDYGTRNYSSCHVYVRDFDKGHYSVWEWRRTMDDLWKEGFRGSMVQAIAAMLYKQCPYYHLLDEVRADPNLWVKNQNSEDGMKSLVRQIEEEIEKLRKEDVKAKKTPKPMVNFLPGAQSDIACIQVLKGMWADPSNPQFKIFENCSGQIQELEELEWEDWAESQQHTRNLREKLKDHNNHSWDDLKYYLMSYQDPSKKPDPKVEWGTAAWYLEQLKRDGYDVDVFNPQK